MRRPALAGVAVGGVALLGLVFGPCRTGDDPEEHPRVECDAFETAETICVDGVTGDTVAPIGSTRAERYCASLGLTSTYYATCVIHWIDEGWVPDGEG